MAYTPNTWKDGDVITAAKLNALEAGVGAAKDGAAGAKGEKGDTGATGEKGATGAAGKDALTIKSIAIDATAGTATLTMSDDTTVAGTYTPKATA